MHYVTSEHRHANTVCEGVPEYASLLGEITTTLDAISDEMLIEEFRERVAQHPNTRSISASINVLIRERLVEHDWEPESPIFQHEDYAGQRWRLDFAKGAIAVEVGFNHGEAIAWNLLKPVLSGDLNHVQKAIQTRIGVIITVTDGMKEAGNFDRAVGTYEKYLRYLPPLQSVLTVPLVVIGLERPDTFVVEMSGDTAAVRILE